MNLQSFFRSVLLGIVILAVVFIFLPILIIVVVLLAVFAPGQFQALKTRLNNRRAARSHAYAQRNAERRYDDAIDVEGKVIDSKPVDHE